MPNPDKWNALSIDVEEWYQTTLIGKDIDWPGKSDLPENIDNILKILDAYKTKATFFVVGSVAQKYPDVIRAIAKEGHEIAGHGYQHRLVYALSKDQFSQDARYVREILREICGNEVIGYRAPSWSIGRRMGWALEVLKSLGYRYDSSMYPRSLNVLRCLSFNRYLHMIDDDFFEFPPSVFSFLGYNIPFCGGAFLRFFSGDFIVRKIRQINDSGSPAMIYLHSWEFDNLPAVCKEIPRWKYILQYNNIDTVRGKINLLLQSFRLRPVKDFFVPEQDI